MARRPDVKRLARENEGFVRALALRLAPLPGCEEDITQQVLVEFIAKGEKWDLSRDVRPLLWTMTQHVAQRLWAEKCREMSPELRALAEHIQRISEAEEVVWYSDEEKTALKHCLEKLPGKSRRIVEVYYSLGVSSADLARQMRISADAVRQALCRLRRQLRQCIEDYLEESRA